MTLQMAPFTLSLLAAWVHLWRSFLPNFRTQMMTLNGQNRFPSNRLNRVFKITAFRQQHVCRSGEGSFRYFKLSFLSLPFGVFRRRIRDEVDMRMSSLNLG